MSINYTRLSAVFIALLVAFSTQTFAAVSPAPSVTAAIGTPANGVQHYINVTWTAATGATGYEIQSSPDGVTWTTVDIAHGAGGSSFDDDASDSGNVAVYFRVIAFATGDTAAATNCAQYPIYTACNVPPVPVLTAGGTTIGVQLDADSNTTATTYAIYCTSTGQYVQANGTLGATEVFNTLAGWGAISVNSLASNTTYCFYALAQNNDGNIQGGQGATVSAVQNFDATSSLSTNGASGNKWWTENTCTGSSEIHWVSGGCGGSTGEVGFTTSPGEYLGCFLTSPVVNCTGLTQVTMTFDLTSTASTLGDNIYFSIWSNTSNMYYPASAYATPYLITSMSGATLSNGNLLLNTTYTCQPITLTWDLTQIPAGDRGSLYFYLNDYFYESSGTPFNILVDNITVTQATATACATTCNSSASAPVVNVSNNCGNSVLTTTATGALLWSPGGQTTSSITVSSGGTYSVTQTVSACPSPAGTATAAPVTLSPSIAVTNNCGNSVLSSNTSGSGYLWSTDATTSSITVTSSATYSLTLTASGCSGTATSAVSINPIPTVGENASPSATVCAGSSVTLNGTGATSYIWTGGVTNGVAFMPSGTNTYTVTGTTNGCSGTFAVTVTATPLPTVSLARTANICPGASAYIVVTGSAGNIYSWSPTIDLTCTNCANPSAYPDTTTEYIVTATNSGCNAQDTITVVVTPLNATVSPGASVCKGDSVMLSAGGGNMYRWRSSTTLTDSTSESITFIGATTATYTVTVSQGSCSATKTTSVTVYPAPPVPRITQSQRGDTLFCSTNPVYTSYQWYRNDTLLVGQTDTFYVATQTSNYNVAVKNENGCAISVGINFTLAGVYNFTLDNSITLFPNPANDELTIRSSSIHGNEMALISVMDVLGKTVQQEQVNWSDNTMVNIKALSAGIYFLQLQFTASNASLGGQSQGKWIGRFVKE